MMAVHESGLDTLLLVPNSTNSQTTKDPTMDVGCSNKLVNI